jgi:hypothetical protein
MKFRRGLNSATQDKVAESGSDRPLDSDIEGWYKAAKRFDRNRLANEAFHSGSNRRTTSSSTSTSTPSFTPRNTFSRTLSPSATATPSFPTAKSTPAFARSANDTSQDVELCYRCKKPGHRQRDCPSPKVEIRALWDTLSDEDREELRNDFANERDILEAKQRCETAVSEDETVAEDFQRDSK